MHFLVRRCCECVEPIKPLLCPLQLRSVSHRGERERKREREREREKPLSHGELHQAHIVLYLSQKSRVQMCYRSLEFCLKYNGIHTYEMRRDSGAT